MDRLANEEDLEPIALGNLIEQLRAGSTANWRCLNGIPGKELLWEGGFPGHTELSGVADEINKAAKEYGLDEFADVFPIITHVYQFSVALAVYA